MIDQDSTRLTELSHQLKPRANFWVEKEGEVALSLWRVQLLEAIGETGSISEAADRLQVSYHRAWDKIHEMEERLGCRLLDTHVGGAGGGGARLTPEAKEYIQRFRMFSNGLQELIQRRFQEAFSDQG
jgi:molybdate transport system regulatory protein